jgi:hypothetical protein
MGPILLGRLSALASERDSRCVLAMRVASFAPLKHPGEAQQQRMWTAIFLDCPDRTQLGLVCYIVFAMPAAMMQWQLQPWTITSNHRYVRGLILNSPTSSVVGQRVNAAKRGISMEIG